jgi:hypothetical protein
MSHKGVIVKELYLYFEVVPKTIYEWFDLWDTGGKYPRNLKGVIAELIENYSLKITIKILNDTYKKAQIHMALFPRT